MAIQDPAQPMIDWLNNAPPAELAVELMTVFGPEVPRPTLPGYNEYRWTEWVFRAYPKQTGFITRARPVQQSMLEAIQLLEHSELIYVRIISDDARTWEATRLGLATLAGGRDAIRRRIRDRTGL